MKITEDLIQRSKGLLQLQDEVNDWTNSHYKMFNDAGVEVEVGEFLYGLVRVLKPIHILETGTHHGVSAAYMGQAMCDNGLSGRLDTIEHHEPFYLKARELFSNLGLENYIYAYKSNIDSFHPRGTEYELMFLDSEPDRRFAELVRFFPSLKPGGFVFIHDLHEHLSQQKSEGQEFGWPFGKLPEQIKTWLKNDELRVFNFPTPRGLTGFYKPKSTVYRWY